MMTKLEQEQIEMFMYWVPKIARYLESIAKSLETLRCNAAPKDAREYDGMGPGSDDV